MPEQIDCSPPHVRDTASTTVFRVKRLVLDWSLKRIEVVVGGGSFDKLFAWTGAVAETMMIALNTANLTNNSLHRRILQRLIDDGKITGTISGSP